MRVDDGMEELSISSFQQRWGESVAADGFVQIPNVLLRKQASLGLSAQELLTLLNILEHWRFNNRLPFPSTERLAERMGVSKRSIERSIRKLTEKKLLQRAKSKTHPLAFSMSGTLREAHWLAEQAKFMREQSTVEALAPQHEEQPTEEAADKNDIF